MAFEIHSTPQLAADVSKHPEAPIGAGLKPVPELAGSRTVACGRHQLLAWMGALTAGPPSLTAEALRTAGAWALIRYFWAIGYNARGSLAPTERAIDIRHHNRVAFSEAVGVGVGGRLACRDVVSSGPVLVANLDDALGRLVSKGVVSAPGPRSKHPDYLLASLEPAGWQLFAIECKGTVSGRSKTIEQMARGTKQVLSLRSSLPLRRLVFGTTLELDDEKKREIKAYAVEAAGSSGGGEAAESLSSVVLDAALVRALNIAGEHEQALRVQQEGVSAEGLEFGLEANLESIDGHRMAGARASWRFPTGTVEAEVGVSVALLRALADSSDAREERVRETLEGLDSTRGPERSADQSIEYLMPDGVGIRLAWSGEMPLPPVEDGR